MISPIDISSSSCYSLAVYVFVFCSSRTREKATNICMYLYVCMLWCIVLRGLLAGHRDKGVWRNNYLSSKHRVESEPRITPRQPQATGALECNKWLVLVLIQKGELLSCEVPSGHIMQSTLLY